MSLTRERFASGLTYEQYKVQMTRNRERLEANERDLNLAADDVATFRALPETLPVLVLAEDWCGDVIANLPVLGRLAAESGKLDVRVFLRDQNPDLMDQYLNQGKYRSIPVFVFFDPNFRELGRFVERPVSVTEERDRRRAALFAAHPEFGSMDTPMDQLSEEARAGLMQAMAQMRADIATDANATVARDLRAIIEKAGG
ncbi:MAG: thioredoxin family protein [Chloroflexota bacterium]